MITIVMIIIIIMIMIIIIIIIIIIMIIIIKDINEKISNNSSYNMNKKLYCPTDECSAFIQYDYSKPMEH